jgi:hypothetical protein
LKKSYIFSFALSNRFCNWEMFFFFYFWVEKVFCVGKFLCPPPPPKPPHLQMIFSDYSWGGKINLDSVVQ